MAISFSRGMCNRIYDVLIEEAGAIERERGAFIHHYSSEVTLPSEWYFYGKLGFKGKFLVRAYDDMCVDCYEEDKTPERVKIIKKVNALLKKIYDSLE